MLARKLMTGSVAGAMTLSVIALTAGSASAAYTNDPNNDVTPVTTGGQVVAGDFVGVGSDTTEGVMAEIARAYNGTRTTGRIVTYASASPAESAGNTIPVEGGAEIVRPRGSGGGLNRISTANDARVDFARSSAAITATQASAGLRMFPFAKDVVKIAVQNPSNYAPASLSGAELVRIYSCNTNADNWSDFPGGPNLAITPILPSTGSGTRNFFLDQLKAANAGVDVALGPCVNQTNIQEHDPAPIVATNGSLAPFSEAKSKTVTGRDGIRLLGGFAGERAVYNVVRGTEASQFSAIFGETGFICGTQAGKDAVNRAGFERLLPVSQGGVCGQLTPDPTSNLLTQQVATTTTVTVTSASASSARVVARITSGSGTPGGTVSFFEGAAQVAGNVPVAQGQAVAVPSAAPGSHTYRAVFTPAANSAFLGSEGTGTGVVSAAAKSASSISESFPAKAKVKVKTVKGKKKTTVKAVKGSITISGGTTRPSGTVLVKKGSKTVGSGSLINGVATFSISGLKPGTNKLTLTYGGDTATNGGVLNFTVKAGKTSKKKGKK